MRRIALFAALFCAVSCKRSEDEAARARINSPQQPVGELPEAKEKLHPARLAEDPALAHRVLHMQRREIDQRIGAHKAQQRVQFAWFRGPGLPDGGSEVSLAEETTLLEGPGDEFSVRLVNDRNQGFELVWVKGEAFVKSLYGAFHKRRTDRTDPPRIREQAMSGLVTSSIGKDPNLKAPQFEPETSVPHAVKDPLRFLGKGPAAGPQPPAGEEPEDSEEDETPPR